MKIVDKDVSTTISLYLRVDEVKAIHQILAQQKDGEKRLTRHGILKFAIRRFLFPDEKIVPLDGMAIELRNGAPYMKHKHPVPHELIIDDEKIEFEDE